MEVMLELFRLLDTQFCCFRIWLLKSPNAEVTSSAKKHQLPSKHILWTYIPTTEETASGG